jgi:putative transposase
MLTVDTNSPIKLDDGMYQFVGQNAGILRLKNSATGEYRDLHLAELAQRVVGLAPTMKVAPRDLDSVPQEQRREIRLWVGHILEVTTGIHPDRRVARPEYDLDETRMGERVDSKVAELNNAGIKASRSNTLRKIKLYREHGTLGLVDQRTLRQTAPLANLNDDVHDALCHVIEEQKNRSTGTKSRLIFETAKELRKRHGASAPEMPSEASMYRYINALTAGKHTTGSAKTRRSLANRPDRTFKKQSQILPGAEVQVDSTKLDVFVRTPSGNIVRPILTIMVDIATRSILASTIRLDATMSVDHVALLAQALTPGQNRPDKSIYRAAVQLANPQASLLSSDERAKLELSRPFVFPRVIMMDNGMDYLGGPFLAAMEAFGISSVLSAPRTPTGKAIVERTFGSINTLFVQYQHGYTGRSPEFRGYDVEKDPEIVDIDALYELFDDWVLKVWQNRPHNGLRDRVNPSVTVSPNQMMAAAAEITSNIQLPLTEDLYIELLPSDYRVISSVGIEFNNAHYDSRELHAIRGTKSSVKKQKGKWEFKYDPYNKNSVWVRSKDGAWMECPRRDNSTLLNPHRKDHEPTAKQRDRAEAARTNSATTGTPIFRPEPVAAVTSDQFENDGELVDITPFDPTKE